MELVDVDVVGTQHVKTGFQVLPHSLGGLSGGLGSDYHLVPDAGEGVAQLLLAVGVGSGGVEVVHAPVHRFLEEIGGLLLCHPLDGQTAKAVFLNGDSGGAQLDFCHEGSPFLL